jgi:putative transposase
MVDAPQWLATDWLLAGFGSRRRAAIERYRAFVEAGKNQPSPWESLKNQIFLGSDAFVEGLQHNRSADGDLSEIPAVQRRPVPKPLSHYAQRYESRDEAILKAYASGGFTQREIGQHFGVHYSRVSRIVRGRTRAKGKI